MRGQAHSGVHIITHRMKHHAVRSGYDRLADYLDADVIEAEPSLPLPARAMAHMANNMIRRAGLTWYNRRQFWLEAKALRKWLQVSGHIFHILYGENSYRYLYHGKRLRSNAIVCTYHTPPARFREVVKKSDHIRRLDAVVVVSNIQRECFDGLIDSDRVHFVPHGIDTEFFRPTKQRDEDPRCLRCLCVGSHLRDLDTLARVAEALRERKDIVFDVVTARQQSHYFKGLPNVNLYCGISDDMLLQRYHEAHIMVLPLIDATANNSLLEAMACGLPVITTDLPAVRDYLSTSGGVLCGINAVDQFVDAIVHVHGSPQIRNQMGQNNLIISRRYAWPKIALDITQVYGMAVSQHAAGKTVF